MTPIPEAPSTNTQLPFDIDDRSDPTLIIAYAWVPLVIKLFRSMGAAQAINDAGHIKQCRRGLMPAQLVETLRALRGNTSGADTFTNRLVYQHPGLFDVRS
jgi:hypothetical protein